jgi:putative ABC transport system permease protein
MKTLKYIWRNVMRNKVRSFLTIMSIGFSFTILTILYGYLAMQDVWRDEAAKNNRIVVMNIQGFSGKLPISYVDDVREMEGIKAAVPYSWFGGELGDEKMPFAQFGTDASCAFQVWDEFKIAPEQLKAWQQDKQGFVVDRRIAEKRGWKVGERIVLKGTFYPINLELNLCGTFDSPKNTDSMWFHWNYMDELLKKSAEQASGSAGTIFAKTADSSMLAEMCDKVDKSFSNSNDPTRTQTEAAFAQMFSDMVGNMRKVILYIGLAVVFSLSLIAANAMAMSMRERTTEIAVLKAIGFSKHHVLGMVLGESMWISFLGGVLGMILGCLALQGLHGISAQFIPLDVSEIMGLWLGGLILTSGCIGLVSGFIPAFLASQRSVVDGLRRVV